MCYWLRVRHVDQWHRTKNPEREKIDPHKYAQQTFDRCAKAIQWRKNNLWEMMLEQLTSIGKWEGGRESRPESTPCIKTNLKLITHLYLKCRLYNSLKKKNRKSPGTMVRQRILRLNINITMYKRKNW